ncbi:MAG: hypothetical protein NT099_08590 [Candidatus Saganbacteria bacterium]|nr:hypothetical protein [Candidatus Saganbacteria bacterium]
MKRFLTGILVICFFISIVSGFAFAQKQPRDPADIKAEIKRVESYIDTLNDKLANAKSPYRVQELTRMVSIYENRLNALENELETVSPGSRPQSKIEQTPPPAQRVIAPTPPEVTLPPRTIGVSGGLIANMPALVLEMRFNRPLNINAAAFKVGLGFAKGKDSQDNDRQNIPLFLTGIYQLTAPDSPGLNPYFGFGINLNLLTSFNGESKMGAFGADLLFGMSGDAGPGEMFAEIGYDLIRTGNSPDYQGLGFMLGYRQPW